MTTPGIAAIDLFCGVGGLSHGLMSAGVEVVAGIDIDPACRTPFDANIGEGKFIERDVREVNADDLEEHWPEGAVRLLAGCAPCQPFSPYNPGADKSTDMRWPLLDEMSRLVAEIQPDYVTMENVPRLANASVFEDFVHELDELGYHVDWKRCRCVDYGLPQDRRRLVLIASLHGDISIPDGSHSGTGPVTVSDTIRGLPAISSGEVDPTDPLHRSRNLSDTNLRRIEASSPGGTWLDWPEELRAPCHQKASGASFKNVYARMEWDKPSPTITTLFHNFGAGRFGHPEQDRSISIREAAMLQGFPRDYEFVGDGQEIYFAALGRLIGNAVPPPIGEMIGRTLLNHAA